MLIPEKTLLIVIDVQGKLADVMHGRDEIFDNINRLSGSARLLEVPVLITEQLPDKLGPTREELSELSPNLPTISKSSFSCCGETTFTEALESSGKKQILLCGIEAHICVLQTALDLLEAGFEVFVAADAVASRTRSKDREKSALMSSMCSMPTDTRTRSLLTPEASCSASVSCWWVVLAGWITRVLASPTLARCEANSTPSIKARPASTPPRIPNVSTQP